MPGDVAPFCACGLLMGADNRRIGTRYDKTALSFLSFLHLAGIYLWLK